MFSAFKDIKRVFSRRKAEGSAFIKLNEHTTMIAEAQGRIIALDAAREKTIADAHHLEAEVNRVHGDSQETKLWLTDILDSL